MRDTEKKGPCMLRVTDRNKHTDKGFYEALFLFEIKPNSAVIGQTALLEYFGLLTSMNLTHALLNVNVWLVVNSTGILI